MFLSYAIKRYPNYIIFREVVPFITYFEKTCKEEIQLCQLTEEQDLNKKNLEQIIMLKNSIYIMNHFDKCFDKYRNMKNNDWHRYSQFSLPYSYIKKG